jgi:flagellar FliL protein
MSETNTTEAPKKKKGGFFKIVLLLLVAVAAGGGGAYFYFMKAAPVHAKEAKPEPPPAPTGIIPLEPFVVNLADTGATRFLRVTLSLVVQDEEQAKEMEEHAIEKARVRSAILELLAEQQSEALATPEGKEELKKALAERVAHASHELKVKDVLFSEFVIQF